jgi:hypothetical protein
MTGRTAVAVSAALALAAMCAWMLIPPFPAPTALIDNSPSSLTSKFGPPTGSIAISPVPWHPANSVAWEKSRGVAVWSLQADWQRVSTDPMAYPDSVSRCLRILWVNLSLQCDVVARARVMAPNHLERP